MYRCEELTILIDDHVQQLNMKQVLIGRVKISESGILEVLARAAGQRSEVLGRIGSLSLATEEE